MRIAVLSDIHGNLAALEAVLEDVRRREVDLTVNLGDICSGGLFPRETAERLIPLDLPTIRGNHERQVLTGVRERMSLSDRHAFDALSEVHLHWMASLPATLSPTDDVLMVHGTPASDLEYFLDTVTEDGARAASLDEVLARTGGETARLILCGHTHIPREVRLPDGRLIVNPGSVGLPAYDDDRPYPHVMETGSPHARYAIASGTEAGWTAEFLTIEYDWDQAARDAGANDRPDWVRALRTGRV